MYGRFSSPDNVFGTFGPVRMGVQTVSFTTARICIILHENALMHASFCDMVGGGADATYGHCLHNLYFFNQKKGSR